MIYYTVLFISFFLLALVIRIKRFVFHGLAENSVSLVNELISDLDEDLKIERIQKSTNKLIFSLFKMFQIIILAIIVGAIPIIAYSYLANVHFNNLDFSSFYAILDISAGATLAFLIPFKKKIETNYSELSQLLHRMALNNYYVANKLFKREVKNVRKKQLKSRTDFVIISGLARAGTTSLMNDISKIEKFVSLSYANMPFLMCPNIWAKFYKPKNKNLQERSHKDGIMIGYNSNEALEEYFFKVKSSDSYITENSLMEYNLSSEIYNDYIDYQNIIKLSDEKIYLAKNNNFILRYNSIRVFNDDFVMVILYREPLTHASSLLEKHREYKKLQQDDPFVLEYMNWLGHHEFGLNQKQFVFNASEDVIADDKDTLDYWLKIWINYYNHVIAIHHPKTLFINYDSYCNNPKRVIQHIVNKLNIDADIPDYTSFQNKRKAVSNFSENLYESAKEIYDILNNK